MEWTKASPSRSDWSRLGRSADDALASARWPKCATQLWMSRDSVGLPADTLETGCWWCVITVHSLCSQAASTLLGVLALRSTWEHRVLLELQRELKLLGSAALAEEPVLDSGSWLGPPGGREVCDITVGLWAAHGGYTGVTSLLSVALEAHWLDRYLEGGVRHMSGEALPG